MALPSQQGCVLCGKCLEVCPLLAATGREELSPRAKAHLEQLLERSPELVSEADAAELASMCLGCGRCARACSRGVDVPALVARLRASHPHLKTWLWKQFLTRSHELWPLVGRASKMIPEPLAPGRLSGLLKLARSVGRERTAPFVRVAELPREHQGREALLFSGCAAQATAFGWTDSAQDLCSGLGLSLISAEFACCGAGLGAAGLARERLDAVRRNVDIWRAAGNPMVVAFCASCLAGLAAYATDCEVFDDEAEAALWTGSLTPLSALLNSARFVVSPDAPRALAYHRPCHGPLDSRHGPVAGQEAGDPDENLVRAMFGAVSVSERCCGFGGIMQLGAPGLSKQVAERCWSGLDPQAETLVVSGCTACVLNLSATAPEGVNAAHWLECLMID